MLFTRNTSVFISDVRDLSKISFLLDLIDSRETLELLKDAESISVSDSSLLTLTILAIDLLLFLWRFVSGDSLRLASKSCGLLIVLLLDLLGICFS